MLFKGKLFSVTKGQYFSLKNLVKMECCILEKELQDKKYLISFLSVLLNYLFASLASISINIFPIATHAKCGTYDPH